MAATLSGQRGLSVAKRVVEVQRSARGSAQILPPVGLMARTVTTWVRPRRHRPATYRSVQHVRSLLPVTSAF